jgi:hypothetical protein
MEHVIGCQAPDLLVVLDQLVDLFAEEVDVLLIADDLDLIATGNQFEFGKILSDDVEVRIVHTEKFHRVERVDRNDYFTHVGLDWVAKSGYKLSTPRIAFGVNGFARASIQ